MGTIKNNNIYIKLKPFIFISLAALFLLLEMALQVSVSVITPELMHDVGLSPVGIGIISSFFFYSYTFMQIPGGLFFDCFSAKKLISLSLLCCTIGTILFAGSNTIMVASVGRLLIGFGSAFAWISVLYIGSQWFFAKYFALISGLGMVIASLGAMGGQMPLALLVNYAGWRNALYILAGIGGALTILVFLLLEDKNAKLPFQKKFFVSILQNLQTVVKCKQIWFIALFAFAIWTPITAFASLWGVPFLKTAYSYSTAHAAFNCSLIWIGVAVGSPLFGWWSEKIKNRKQPLIVGTVLGVVSSFLIIYLNLNPAVLYTMLFLLGVGAGGQALSFALIRDITSENLVGSAMGFNNMAVVASGFIFQPLIGYLLNTVNGNSGSNIAYSLTDYRYALIIIPLIFVVSMVVGIFFIKETYNRKIIIE
jgi:MFS family permease